jgi:hypothetical protein
LKSEVSKPLAAIYPYPTLSLFIGIFIKITTGIIVKNDMAYRQKAATSAFECSAATLPTVHATPQKSIATTIRT